MTKLDCDRWPTEPENHAAIKNILSVFQCPSTPGSPRLLMTWAHGGAKWDSALEKFSDPDVPAGATDYHALSHVSAPKGSTFFFGTDSGAAAWAPRPITTYQQFTELGGMARQEGTSVYSRRARLSQIKDGLSNTVLIVERGGYEDVACDLCGDIFRFGSWASAEFWQSLDFDDQFNLPDVGWLSGGDGHGPISYPHPHAAMCDGSVRTCTKEVDSKILWALVTRAGGEAIEVDQ